jgi:hypothetical protein
MGETQRKALSHARQLSEIDSCLKFKEIELCAQGDDPPLPCLNAWRRQVETICNFLLLYHIFSLKKHQIVQGRLLGLINNGRNHLNEEFTPLLPTGIGE